MNKKLLYLIVILTFSCASDDTSTTTTTPTIKNNQITSEEEIREGSLNSFFLNSLISDNFSNIDRNNPIKITEYNQNNNQIKTNYSNLNI